MNTLPNGMKKYRFFLILTLVTLVSLLLSSCTGGTMVNGWPGLSANQDVVYLSNQGAVYAVNATSGTMVWRSPKDKPDPNKPFLAAPAFGPDGLIVAGNYAQVLYALNSNGDVKWEFKVENAHFVASPLIVEGIVLSPASDGYLYAVGMEGTQRWKYKTTSGLFAQPASDGTLVFQAGLDHMLYALRVSDGSLVWKTDLESSLMSAPVLDKNGALYISTMTGNVVSVNSKDGSVQWTTPTQGSLWSSPVLGEGMLYVGNAEGKKAGKVLAISTADGSVTWKQDAGSPVIAGGALITDMVVFPTEGGSLTAWSLKDGKQEWTQVIGGKLYTTPVVSGDHLIVAVTQGDKLLQAVSFTGQIAWPFVLPK